MPETQYQIHNTTRDPQTRLARAQSPTTSKMTLHLGGGSLRIIRKRPVVVYESVVRKLLPELLRMEKSGLLKVTTVRGERVDLGTMQPLEKLPVAPPLPHPPLDSAARDKQNVGQRVTKWADPKATPRGPNVPLPKTIENRLQELEEAPVAPLPVVVAEPPAPEPVVVPSLVQAAEEPVASEEPEAEHDEQEVEVPSPFGMGFGGKKSKKHRR